MKTYTEQSQFNEPTTTFWSADKVDYKGREIGWNIGLRTTVDGLACFAWVQSARRVNGVASDFGVPQRSQQFADSLAAWNWAYSTMQDRKAKLD